MSQVEMTQLVGQHELQLRVAGRQIQQATMDVDVAPHVGKRIHGAILQQREGVIHRRVLARRDDRFGELADPRELRSVFEHFAAAQNHAVDFRANLVGLLAIKLNRLLSEIVGGLRGLPAGLENISDNRDGIDVSGRFVFRGCACGGFWRGPRRVLLRGLKSFGGGVGRCGYNAVDESAGRFDGDLRAPDRLIVQRSLAGPARRTGALYWLRVESRGPEVPSPVRSRCRHKGTSCVASLIPCAGTTAAQSLRLRPARMSRAELARLQTSNPGRRFSKQIPMCGLRNLKGTPRRERPIIRKPAVPFVLAGRLVKLRSLTHRRRPEDDTSEYLPMGAADPVIRVP